MPEVNKTPTERINYIGITSAKQPHIGHLFLLLKGFASAPPGTSITLKLNDTGPRVAQAIDLLARQHDISFEQAASLVTEGTFSFSDIEQAYMARDGQTQKNLPEDFQLRASNDYYRQLIAAIEPTPGSIQITSDSEILATARQASPHPAVVHTLSTTGPTFFNADKPIVIESGGKTTLQGILILLGRHAIVNVTSSPRAFSKAEQISLKKLGIVIEQAEGMGVSVDFNVASGTNGNSLDISGLIRLCEVHSLSSNIILPALRRILERSFFIPGEGASLNPNFASIEVIQSKFVNALHEQAHNSAVDIYQPLHFKDVTSFITKDFIAKVIYSGEVPTAGRFTTDEVGRLIKILPGCTSLLSEHLCQFTLSSPAEVIPKPMIEDTDRTVLNALRSGNAQYVLPLLSSLAHLEPEDLEHTLKDTHLLYIAACMGYNTEQLPVFIKQVIRAGKLYVIDKSDQMCVLRPNSGLPQYHHR